MRVCCKFTTESASERSLKIGLHLRKYGKSLVSCFLTHSVVENNLVASHGHTQGPDNAARSYRIVKHIHSTRSTKYSLVVYVRGVVRLSAESSTRQRDLHRPP